MKKRRKLGAHATQTKTRALQEGSATFRSLFENANDAIATFTLDGVITRVNRGAERMLGWSRPELVGQHVSKVATPSSVALAEERTRRFLAGEKLSSSTFEAELVRKDGRTVPVEARTRVIRDRRRTPVGFQGIYRDITERKRAEQALRDSEARYRSLFENSLEGLFRSTPTGHFTEVNPALVRMLGYASAEEVVALKRADDIYVDPVQWEHVQALSVATGVIDGVELLWKKKDGEHITVNLYARALCDAQNGVIGYEGMVLDITARKQAEEALRESQEKYRDLVENVNDVIFSVSGNGVITYLSPAAEALSGYSPAELIGRSFSKFVYPEDLPVVLQSFQRSLADHPKPGECRVITKSGEIRWVRSSTRVTMRSNRIVGIQGVVTDITERKQAEEKILQAKREWEATSDAVSDLIVLTDVTGIIRRCNRAVSHAFKASYQELLGRPIQEVFYGSAVPATEVFQAPLSAQALQGSSREEGQFPRLDGWFTVVRHPLRSSESDALDGFVYILTDITERKRMEEMLRERVIQPHDIAGNLRNFRKELGMSQKEFGQAFGGYSQRQINSYETGEIEVPISLLLAIKNRGYSLDVVLAPSEADAITRAIGYLSSNQRAHELVRLLVAGILRILDQEHAMTNDILHQLGFPQKRNFTKEAALLSGALRRVGLLPLDVKEEDG